MLDENDPVNGSLDSKSIDEFDNVPVFFTSRLDTERVQTHRNSYLIESAERINKPYGVYLSQNSDIFNKQSERIVSIFTCQ